MYKTVHVCTQSCDHGGLLRITWPWVRETNGDKGEGDPIEWPDAAGCVKENKMPAHIAISMGARIELMEKD